MTRNNFADLGLSPRSLEVVAELGYEAATPVQEEAIPALLQGRDVVAQAPTGTGKTAAYGLPIIEALEEERLEPQALVLVPTRELAIQIAEALHNLGRHRQVVTLPIYGGQPYDRQFRALKRGVQVVVATPGRLTDHLERGTLKLDSIRMVVLDEADEMLNMGFIEDIERILSAVPDEHQTALFSATIAPRIRKLAARHLKDPVQVSVATQEALSPRVRQVYYEVTWQAKSDALARILDFEQPESAIVFVRTRKDADVVAEQLNGAGYIAQAIHGDINQAQRERVLQRFRAGHTQLLVGTDVAARGLDIPDVTHIINYDLPLDAESYVHRIGRTGRAGQTGEALTLVTPRERGQLRMIEQAIHRKIQPLKLPTDTQVIERRREGFRSEVLRVLGAGDLDPFIELVEGLSSSHDITEVAAAAFKMASDREHQHRGGPAPRPSPPAGAPARVASRPHRPMAALEMTRLFLRVGKRDGVRPTDLVGAIAEEAGISGGDIGDIELYDTFSFVDVPAGSAEAVLQALNRARIRGRAPQASIAVPLGEGRRRSPKGAPPPADARPQRRPRVRPKV
ncbi:MAG: DEAD/DEAH box helicase [Candidatus Dormibacteria bacterium]